MPAEHDHLPIRARGLDTLEAAFGVWVECKLEHAAALSRLADERRRLEQQGSFLVGAVRAAQQLDAPAPSSTDAALVPPSALGGFLAEAEQKLAAATAELDRRVSEEDARHRARIDEARAQVAAKVQAFLARVRPKLVVRLRPVGERRAILHVDRPAPDEAVLLFALFSGRIPSRYGYLFDDSTEELGLDPAPLYADEGVALDQTRPDAAGLRARFAASTAVFPAKGFVPVPVGAGPEAPFYRLRMRGPVMELELATPEGFLNVLPREEAERFAGYLVSLKLAGKLELELRAD